MKFVRKVDKNPKLIVSKILALVKGHVALDRQAKLTYVIHFPAKRVCQLQHKYNEYHEDHDHYANVKEQRHYNNLKQSK